MIDSYSGVSASNPLCIVGFVNKISHSYFLLWRLSPNPASDLIHHLSIGGHRGIVSIKEKSHGRRQVESLLVVRDYDSQTKTSPPVDREQNILKIRAYFICDLPSRCH